MTPIRRQRGQEEILLPIGGNEWHFDHFGSKLQKHQVMVLRPIDPDKFLVKTELLSGTQ